MASDGRHSDRGNSVLKLSSLNNSRIGRCPSRISNTASNNRLEWTRHERASLFVTWASRSSAKLGASLLKNPVNTS